MKKLLSLALAVIMIAGATATVFATPAVNSTARITGMEKSLTAGYTGNPGLGNIQPQDRRVEHIDLKDTMFTWNGHTPDEDFPVAIPANILRNARIDVRASNNRVVESVTLNASESRIEVKFVERLVGTRDVDFEFDVFLSIDGRRQTDFAITFHGTLANPVFEVYADTEREDISRGEVAEAQENIRSITFTVGRGVYVTTRMFNNERVYAVASHTPDASDERVFDEHRSIVEVIHLR